MFSTSSTPLRALLCLCLALAFLASGCTAVGSTRPVVKIGLVAPFEGLHRNLGYEVLYAVKLAIRQHNADGEARGPLVELVALDDTQDPSHAVEQARELILDSDVVGVVGHLSSSTTAAALSEYQRAGLALVIPVAMPQRFQGDGDSSESSTSSVARFLAAPEEVQGAIAARFAVDILKARRLVVVGGPGDALAQSFAAEAETWGANVWPAVWPDKELVSSLVQDTPDAIFFAGDPVAGADFVTRVRGVGLDVPIVGSSAWSDPAFARLTEFSVSRVFFAALSPDPRRTLAGRRFVEDHVAYTGQPPSRQAALAYDATQILLEAIERASEDGRTPTREAAVNWLSAVRVYSGSGGQYRFDEKGERVQGPLPEIVAVATD